MIRRSWFALPLALVAVPAFTQGQTPVPSVGRGQTSVLALPADVGFDVRAFGAVGDGVTDDSPAFAKAIQAAGNLSAACPICGSGGRVIVPATPTNVYLLGTAGAMARDAVLTPYGAIVIEASGGGNTSPTLKLANNANRSMFKVVGNVQGLVFRNLHLDGNKANQTGTSHGLWFAGDGSYKDSRHVVQNLFITNFLSNGVRMDFNTSQIDFERVIVRYSGGDGWFINGGDSQFRKCESGYNHGYGWNVQVGLVNEFVGGAVYADTIDGILVGPSAAGAKFYGVDIDANLNNGAHIQTGDVSFIDGIFHDNGQAAMNTYAHVVVDPNLTGIRLIGNHFKAFTLANQAQYAIRLNGALTSSSIIGNTEEANASNGGDLIGSNQNAGFTYTGAGQTGASFAAFITQGGIVDGMTRLTWGTTISVPNGNSTSDYYTITATSNIAATIAAPGNLLMLTNVSQEITFEIFNDTGGAFTTAPVFAGGSGGYKTTGTFNPGNGQTIIVKFRWNPARNFWIQVGTPVIVSLVPSASTLALAA